MQSQSTGAGSSYIGARLSIMMFLQFFIWGAWSVTISNYMDDHGMKEVIYIVFMVGPLAAIISPFFLGMVADRFFATERVLGTLHLLGGVALLAAPQFGTGATAAAFISVIALHALCYMPTLGLTNTLAFHNMTNREKQFPLVRVFGTIGWIVANLVVSGLLKADTEVQQFYVAGAGGLLLGLYSFTLPHTPPPAAGKKANVRDILGLDALSLFRQPSFAVFMICTFLTCIPLAAYYAYAPVFVMDVGIERAAATMSLGQFSEIFFMVAMPFFFARLGVKYMLMVGMLAWALRYGLFAGAANTHMLWMVIGGILLHGICYDFFFVTGQIYVDNKASAAIRGQAQGLLVLVAQGLGSLVGARVAGALVAANTVADVRNWYQIWLIPAVAAAVIMLVFAVFFREDTRNNSEVPAKEAGAAA